MRRLLLAVVLCLLYAAPALAQNVPISQPFSVQFDPGAATPTNPAATGFQCYLDGKPLGAPLPASGRVCAIPGQPAGSHTVEVAGTLAFATGIVEGAKSAPLTATASAGPSAPTNLRIVVQVAVQPSGDVTLLAASVEKAPPTP